MNYIFPRNRKVVRQCCLGLCITCVWLSVGLIPAMAEEKGAAQGSAAPSEKNSILSTDNLQKQISDLDSQIQKLREQSLALQEKTRAKLQSQLNILKRQQDTLLPRIEKLRDNSERAWLDIKESIQKAIEELNISVDSMEK